MFLRNVFLALLPIAAVLGSSSKSCQNGIIKIKDRKCEKYCGWELQGDSFRTCRQSCYQDCLKACAADSRCKVASWNRNTQNCRLSKKSGWKKTGKGDGVYCAAPHKTSTTTARTTSTTSTTTTMTSTTAAPEATCFTFLIRAATGPKAGQFLYVDAVADDGSDLNGRYFFDPNRSNQFRLNDLGYLVTGEAFSVPFTTSQTSPLIVRPYNDEVQAGNGFREMICELPGGNVGPGIITCMTESGAGFPRFYVLESAPENQFLQFGSESRGIEIVLEAVCPPGGED